MSLLRTNAIKPFSSTGIVINGDIPTSAGVLFDFQSTTQGVGLPRMTTLQRNAILAPFSGLMIFNLDNASVETYNGTDWDTVNGVESINGLVAKHQNLIIGTAGTSPNWTTSGGDTHVLNIPNAVTSAVTAGLISNADYTTFNLRLFPNKNVKYVVKNVVLGPQDYNSIADAVNSITDASPTNQYLVVISVGIYTEPQIDVPSNVFVVGMNMDSVIVEPDSATHHVFTMQAGSSLNFLSIRNAGSGFAGILMDDPGDFTVVHKVSILDCDIGVWARASTQDSFNYLEYVDTTGGTTSVLVEASSGFKSYVSLENYHVYASDAGINPTYGVKADGANAEVLIEAATFEGADDTGTAIYVNNGARADAKSVTVRSWMNAILSDTGGSGALINVSGTGLYSNVNDIVLNNSTTTAIMSVLADLTKCTFDPGVNLTLNLTDDVGLATAGVIRTQQPDNTFTDQSTLITKASSMGVMQGGEIVDSGTLSVTINAGFGYVETSGGSLKRFDWTTQILTLPANQSSYIFVNSSGSIVFSGARPASSENILLGRVVTGATSPMFVDSAGLDARHSVNLLDNLLRRAVGPVYASGSTVSESGTRGLNVTAGARFLSTREFDTAGGSGVSWDAYVGNAFSSTQSTVDNSMYDSSGTLTAITAGWFVKHSLYVVGQSSDSSEKYLLVYAQAQYATIIEAEQAVLPSPPSTFIEGVTPIASIIVQQGHANIIEIKDERPRFGFSATGISANAVHGNLLGLDADDHHQYLILTGIRAMTGDLNMGGNSITNVNLVDGVDVSAHAARHLPSGADPIATAAPITSLSATTSNATGTAESLSRSDHSHAILTGTAVTLLPDQSNSPGISANLIRADHVHNIPTAAPSGTIGANSTNSLGVAASFARADHGHQLATGTPVVILPDQANAAGTSNNLSRADHVHAIVTAIAVDVSDSTNSQGASTSFSRADHVHSHGNRGGGSLHALATTSVAGFLSAADKVRVDSIETIADGRITLQKGVANGLATLDATTKIPISQIPDSIVGSVKYQGTWNASTNTPNLVTASPTKGDYYVVNVAGSTSLSGITDWKIGDWAIYNGTAWEKVDNTDQVVSVFGRQGLVVAADADYTAAQIVYSNTTSGLISTRVQAAIDELVARFVTDETLLNAHASRHLPLGADPIATAAPIAAIGANSANGVGSANSLARSDHSHSLSTGAPSAQAPDQANAAGASNNLARADHVHNIPTAAAVGLSSTTTNTQGSSGSFARADHTHAIATGAPSTQNPDQSNAAGSSANLAKADHIHNIPTSTAVTSNTNSTNATGSSVNFSRADHVHKVVVDNYEATGTGTTTTTSTSQVLMDSMTLTPPAGTYMAIFSTSLQSSSAGSTVICSLFAGGVQKADSQRRAIPRFDASGGLGGNANTISQIPMSTQGLLTVNGSQAIEGRWQISGGGTATAFERTLTLLRIA